MFADHSTPQAGSTRAAYVAEDDEHELDPEYAPKRFHTTKASCCYSTFVGSNFPTMSAVQPAEKLHSSQLTYLHRLLTLCRQID